MTTNIQVRLGLMGIGLDSYWPQFEGLKQRLEGYEHLIHNRLAGDKITVVDAGLVDNLTKAANAAGLFSREQVDLIFLYVSTYALSSTVLPVVKAIKAPVVVLNLQPTAQIDYAYFNSLPSREEMTSEWLAYCQACATPEIASVFNRAGIDYHLVTGTLDDSPAWAEIGAWVDAAYIAKTLRCSSIGLLGHYYCGMMDVYSDYTQLAAVFGNHFEIVEMDELKALRDLVTEAEVEEMVAEFRHTFDVSAECSETELRRAARTSCALQKLSRLVGPCRPCGWHAKSHKGCYGTLFRTDRNT